MKLSIIVPAYNEGKTIGEVIEKLRIVKIPNVKKQIIIVNDGSSDDTKKILAKEQIKDKSLLVYDHTTNVGKGAAVRSGIKIAAGDYILIQDADLEYNPEDISKLIQAVYFGETSVVYGTRLKRLPNFTRDERTMRFFVHYMGNKFLSLVTSILYGQWITDMETGYKLFSKEALQGITLRSKSFNFEPEITAKFLKKGLTIVEVPISTNPRGYAQGKKLNTFKDGFVALLTLLKYRFIN